MSPFPFTHPTAMGVMLLTLTTILAVTSDQELNAYYKSLGPGYSYGYLQASPPEQFFSTRNLVDCTAFSLRSQSHFFTYNKVSHVCKNYPPKNIMTVVSSNDNNETSFYRSDGWIKVYALSMGAGSNVYNSFLNIGSPSLWKVDNCDGTFCPNFFRHPILDFWNNLPIDEVKLVVYKNQTAVVNMVFDGRGTTLQNWFSLAKLKSSPWSDLPAAGVNVFSVVGFHSRRRFYVSSSHATCNGDTGWLFVLHRAYCEWEKFLPDPTIFYSNGDSRVKWVNGSGIADSMAIFIRLKS